MIDVIFGATTFVVMEEPAKSIQTHLKMRIAIHLSKERKNKMDKFVVGEKVYYDPIKRNLIIAQKSGKDLWLCIDPNVCMNDKRCGLFNCFEDNLERGWR